MKTKRANRLLALLLSLVMVAGLLPMSVLAAGEDATAPARYEYVLASDGIDNGGVYAILTSRSPMDSTGSNRILYYSGTADRTNQVTPSAISDDRLSLDTSYDTETQLWEASVVEGGIALRSLAGSGNKYLKVASDSAHAHVDVSEDPQALTITNGVSKSGCTGYSIVQGGYSLNWSGSIYTWNDPANVLPYRFFKQTPVWTVTFTGEEVTESTDEVLDGGNATLPAEPSREGYTFEGWFVGEDEFTAETAVTANVTATAKWEEIPVEPEIPDEPEPQEKTRYYFESVAVTEGAWMIGDGTHAANTLEIKNGSSWGTPEEIQSGGDHNYRVWAPGPGYLNFVKVGNNLLSTKKKSIDQAPAEFHVEAQACNAYIIYYAYTENGNTKPYYLTAENQEYDSQARAVFSPNKADAVPYVIEATAAGAVTYRIYCEGPYTVNFTGEGAEDIASLEGVYYGTTLPTPADREGYTFLGWFDEDGNEYTGVTADVTLTAQWEMDPGYTPEDAIADGKTVTYLAFTGGTNSSRWWDAADEAGDTTKIQLYNAAGTATDSAITLDTDIITAGNYVINFDTGSSSRQAVMHYSNGVTNQCSAVSVTCGTNGPLHVFVFEKAEDDTAINAFTIKAYNTTKYLSLEASGNNRLFKDDKTTFYVTPVNDPNDGTYYIWTATDPEPVPDVPEVDPPAELEKVYEYRLDTDGLDSGEYGITAPGNNRTVGMHDSGSYTNQCPVAITGEVMTLPHDEHKWTVVQQPNGKYTIQGNGGKYLTSADCTSPSNQLVLGTEAEEFTVTHVSGGSYTVQNAAGKYLTFTESGDKRWGMANSAFNIQFYKKTEVEPHMAQTKFSGTSDKPMDRLHILNQDDDVDTEYRIPALVTLDNGWIVAACDIRWSNTEDSPNNLDTIVSVSKNGGATWEWEVVNYFSDFAPINRGGQRVNSASFIDPALLVSNDGTLWMAVDLQPAHVNLRQNAQKTGSGFDENGLLMVGPISEAEWETKVNTSLGRTEATRLEYQAQYEYRVDINGVNSESVTATATKDGEEVTVYAIFHMDTKETTGYYVDAFCDLYYDYGEDGGIKPVLVLQKESTDCTQANLFYLQSPWKAYSTTYLMIRKATVEGDGLVWGDPQLVSGVKNFDGETFLAFCPGRGTSIQVAGENGETVERILFPVYDNVSSEKASAVYTDDGGATWHRGARVENGETSSNSESQIVELHDGEGNPFLRMFSRNQNSGQYVSYADSFDNGLTWTATKFDRDMPNGYGTMMSFIGLEGFLVSPEGAVYEDLVLASYPRGTASNRRENGIVRIGYYDAEAEAMVWLNDKDDVRYPFKFTYSCLTQLRDGDGFTDGFALLYEDERNWAASYGMEMGFDSFTSADLLGEGWSLVQTKPTEDKIIVAPIAKQFYTGEPIEPAVTVKKNGVVLTDGYTVVYSNNTEVGEATVTVTVGEIVVETTFRIVAVVVEPDEYTVLSVIRDQAYTGSPITPAVTVLKNGEVTEDYELEYLNNTEVGTATVNVLVNGEIVASVEFEIIGGEEEAADVYTLGSIAARVYSGEAIEPVVAVYKNGTLMLNGYTVTYENNVNVGTATVIVLVGGVEVARGTFRITEAASTGTDTPSRPAVSVTPEQPEDPVEDLDDPDVPLAGLPMNFADVTRDDWFYDEVKYVFDQELMGGVSSAEFAPNSNTTRAQIVTILYRLEDKPEVEAAVFADVESGDYYAESVAWGQMSGVVTGVGGGNFRPTRDVTREELMVILYRYAKYKALDVTAAGDLSVFQDGATTSDWAVEAMIWAVGAGLIRGKGEARLDPAGTATRAEVAAILMRFCEDFMK